jgi:hypothetical protein
MSDPEMTTFGMYPNWGIEYCKAYAEQLRDKTRANRAVHAAECIEYLLSLVQKEWVGLTDEDIQGIHYQIKAKGMGVYSTEDIYRAIESKLKEKNT